MIRGFFAEWLVNQNGITRMFLIYSRHKTFFTDSNEACHRYSYNLDEGGHSIWLKTAIYPECIGLKISNYLDKPIGVGCVAAASQVPPVVTIPTHRWHHC